MALFPSVSCMSPICPSPKYSKTPSSRSWSAYPCCAPASPVIAITRGNLAGVIIPPCCWPPYRAWMSSRRLYVRPRSKGHMRALPPKKASPNSAWKKVAWTTGPKSSGMAPTSRRPFALEAPGVARHDRPRSCALRGGDRWTTATSSEGLLPSWPLTSSDIAA
jgi:hypothetical protein